MIRVYFIHTFIHDFEEFCKYLRIDEETKNNLIWDPNNPEILIASEWIYYKSKMYSEFKRLYHKAKIKVMYAGEAFDPDFNFFDYGIGFSNSLIYGDRFVRLLSPLDMFPGFINSRENDITNIEIARKCLYDKKGFCNFLYSNPIAHQRRDQLFYELSSYKTVDSLGRHLNNVGKLGTGFVGHAGECSDIKSMYKFSIACENASFCGYTSEKVFSSLCAHTVPIYWGNPDIAEDVNPKAIINANEFKNKEELIDYVRYVDTHDEIWMQMIMEPWMTPEQMEKHNQRTKDYYTFFKWLFSGNVEDKYRVATGTHVDCYRTYFLNGVFPMELNMHTLPQYIDKLKKKIRK